MAGYRFPNESDEYRAGRDELLEMEWDLRDWARIRGWSSIPLYSAAGGGYILDYFAREGASDPALVSMMNVFRRTPEGVPHLGLGAGQPPDGERPSAPRGHGLAVLEPPRPDAGGPWRAVDPDPDCEHAYFSRHVLGGELSAPGAL